jgi:hypothetical protein
MEITDAKKRSAALEYCFVNFGAPIPDEKPKGKDKEYWSHVRSYGSDDDRKSLKTRLGKMETRLDNLVYERSILVSERSLLINVQGKGFANLEKSTLFRSLHFQLIHSQTAARSGCTLPPAIYR